MKAAALLFVSALLLSACGSSAPPRPQGPPAIPGNLAVAAQLPGRLVLTDRSPWQVQPAGQSATLRWRPGEPVSVIRSGHPAWPFLLTSRVSGASALARPSPAF
jgi:hypothetical protein